MADPEAGPRPSFARRHPWLTGCGGLLAVVAVITGFFAIRIRMVAAERWVVFEKRHAESLQRLGGGEGRRTPLIGPAHPGNAWDAYKPAIEAVGKDQKALPKADKDALGAAFKLPLKEETKEAIARLLPGRQPLLDPIRQAARSECALYPVDWTKGAGAEIPGLLNGQYAGQALGLTARSKAEAGDMAGAIDDLAVGLQFGLDQARPPVLISSMIAIAIARIQLDELRTMLESPASCPPADLERIAALLADAERQLPELPDMIETDYVLWTEEHLRQMVEGRGLGGSEGWFGPMLMSWRQGFSIRLMAADLQDRAHQIVEAAREGMAMDAPSAQRHYSAVKNRIATWENVFASMMLPNFFSVDQTVRDIHARLRLLRLAALERLGRPPAEADRPLDPFSLKPLGRKEEPGLIRLWSVSKDGVNGATGSWRPDNDYEDVVLDLKK